MLVSYLVLERVWKHRRSLVGRRGWGPRADVGRLHDLPRVRVERLTLEGPDQARLVLTPVDGGEAAGSGSATAEVEATVALDERDPEYRILEEWLGARSVLGVVMPAESRLIRLRSLDDLQPITLRRLDP